MRLYRVWAARPGDAPDGACLCEMFETSDDAERFFSDIQEDRDGILLSTGFPSVSVTLDECYEGTWVTRRRRLVRLG